MLDSYYNEENKIESYISTHHGQHIKKNQRRNYKSEGGYNRAIIDILKGMKTKYGEPLARVISNLDDEKRRFPEKIKIFLIKYLRI